ncbi:MAG TPA: hypothetical protein PKC06_17475 [Saprospiraceae bacterium]|jgi:uncharacterized protein YodC (DUF2158 family)|nr:hypothetical protein [Saprospiraceae bacterium]
MKFKIGSIVKHKTADFKMLILSFNDENDSYNCRWYSPNTAKNEDGFISTNFDEFELEHFTKKQ